MESFDSVREDMIEAVEAVTEGEEQPALVSFGTVKELRKILTDRRLELL